MEQGPWCRKWQNLLEEKPRASEGFLWRRGSSQMFWCPSQKALPSIGPMQQITWEHAPLPQLELLPPMPAASPIMHSLNTML